MKPAEILRDLARIEPVIRKWREKAEQGMKAGMEYAAAIRNRRVRFATALPAMIGQRTLALLREAGSESLRRKIKVPRGEVRKMMLSSVLKEGRFPKRPPK